MYRRKVVNWDYVPDKPYGPYSEPKRKRITDAERRLRWRWKNMHRQCYNSSDANYKYYGGRGITVCEEWHRFEAFKKWAFANGFHPSLTLDRINNDGNYEPGNCRWVTQAENNRNKRQRKPRLSED